MNEQTPATETEVLKGNDEVLDLNEDLEKQDELKDEIQTPPEEKKPTGWQKRMQRLEAQVSAQVETAKQEAEYWKAEALKRAAPQETPKTRLDFASDDEWIDNKLTSERQKLLQDAQETAKHTLTVERQVATYQQRVTEAKKELKDWDEVFARAQENGITLPHDAIEFCLDSPAGAVIAHHLAKNEEELDQFLTLSPMRRAAHLGKLEERLSKQKERPPATKTTAAPPKLTDVKSGGSIKQPPAGLERFTSKEAWREWRAGAAKRK